MDLKTNDKVKIVKIALPTKYENTTFPFYEEINHGLKINEVEKRYILKSINRPMDLIPKIFYISYRLHLLSSYRLWIAHDYLK